MTKWNETELLRLSMIKKLNSQHHREIAEQYENFDDFYNTEQLPEKYNFVRQDELFPEEDLDAKIETHYEICQKHDIQTISIWDPLYPIRLKQIAYPPMLIFVKGQLQEPDAIGVGIVGTRKCTRYGRLTAERYATALANNNVIVISGLAYGIDTYAHTACINAGGITYAVIACGIDKLGPADAKDKARKIIDAGGAIISHFHPGISPIPPYFLHRNRIIAGLSSAVFVVESGFKGGALNTARHAAEESREVFAAPGNIGAEKSIGTNRLIKYGTAEITTKPEDILKTIGVNIDDKDKKEKVNIEFYSEQEKNIYATLSFEPIHIDMIPEKTGLPITQVLVTLLEMEFRGIVRQLPGKLYVLP
jgi:DNA processing protein